MTTIWSLLARLGWGVVCARCGRRLDDATLKPPAYCHACYYGYNPKATRT